MRALTKINHLFLNRKQSLSSKIRLLSLLVLIVLLSSSCGRKRHLVQGPSGVPEPSENVRANELMDYIATLLTQDDVKAFSRRFDDVCARYIYLDDSMQRKAIAAFSVAISDAESKLSSYTTFYEEQLGYHSIGLFSLSYEDNQDYQCDFNKGKDKDLSPREKTISQTDLQVSCYLKIVRKLLTEPQKIPYLKKLAKKDKSSNGNPANLRVTQKLAAYWSVLRASNESGNKRYQKSLKSLLPGECN